MRFLLYNIRYATGTGLHFHLPVPFSGYFRQSGPNFNRIKIGRASCRERV